MFFDCFYKLLSAASQRRDRGMRHEHENFIHPRKNLISARGAADKGTFIQQAVCYAHSS